MAFNTCHFLLMFSWKGFVQKEVAQSPISNPADNDNTLPCTKHLLTSSSLIPPFKKKQNNLIIIIIKIIWIIIVLDLTQIKSHTCSDRSGLQLTGFLVQILRFCNVINMDWYLQIIWMSKEDFSFFFFFLRAILIFTSSPWNNKSSSIVLVHVCIGKLAVIPSFAPCKLTCKTHINQPSRRGAVRVFSPSPLTHRRCGFLSFRVMGYW